MTLGIWIRAKRGQCCLIDREDQDLAEFTWYIGRKGDFLAFPAGYQKRPRTRSHLSLHRVICERVHGPLAGRLADHINRDRTDNRRENLRWCSAEQSNQNRRGMGTISGYKGVFVQNCKKNPYKVTLEVNGRTVALGGFPTAIDAARAYDVAARRFHGEFAVINNA